MLDSTDLDKLLRSLTPVIRGEEIPTRLGLQLQSRQTAQTTLLNVGTQLIAPNANRVLLLIAIGASAQVNIQLTKPTALGQGITLNFTQLPVIFNVKDHGTLPQLEWFYWSNTAGVTLTCIELLWSQR